MIYAFFGHRNANYSLKKDIEKVVFSIIENDPSATFYVGTQGNFDNIVWSILCKIKGIDPNINCYKILAYMPIDRIGDGENTLYPEGLESIPPRFAIIERNKWMVDKADAVITYVRHSNGGAAKAKALAEKKGKIIIEI